MQDKPLLQNLINQHKVSTFAEIGVLKGKTTRFLLNNCQSIKKYYAVDPWIFCQEGYETQADDFEIWYKEMAKDRDTLYKGRLVLIKKFSLDALEDIEDKSLDMVFIDASHTYEDVKDDILGWREKVRPGGILSGHDYHNRGSNKPNGVTKALQELYPSCKRAGVNSWHLKIS